MAGLVSNAMQPATQQAQPQAAPSLAAQAQGAPTQVPQGVEQPGSKLKNPTLNKIESGIEAKIPQQFMQMYQSIIVACMSLAFNQQTHQQMLKGLQSSPDIYKNIALICAGMIGMVYEQSKQDPNQFLPAAMPASIVLMCQLLEFAEGSGMVKLEDQKIADCTNMTAQAVLRKFGVNGAKLNQAQVAKSGGAGAQAQPQQNQQPAAAPNAPQPQMQGA